NSITVDNRCDTPSNIIECSEDMLQLDRNQPEPSKYTPPEHVKDLLLLSASQSSAVALPPEETSRIQKRKAEQKKLQSFMDETFDMSDEDLADPLADNSEDEYVPSENESERSDDDDTPVRKMQKTEHLPTTSTKISNLYSDTIEAVVADYGDISSPEDYSEDEAAPGDPLKSRLE
ncbi:hypothetical protein QE152_g40100, partial [Popillia japonica]